MTAKEYLNRIRFISAGLRVKEQELQQLESGEFPILSNHARLCTKLYDWKSDDFETCFNLSSISTSI